MITPLHADVVNEWMVAARKHNADILKARAEYQAALAKVPQAKSLPDPMVEMRTMGGNLVDSNQRIMLSQAFPWPGTLGQRESASSFQARAYWHQIQAIELQVAARIRALAAEIGYLKKESGLIKENVDLFAKQIDFLDQRARGGGEVTELVRTEIETSLLKDGLAAVQENLARQKALLEELIGRSVTAKELAAVAPPSSVAIIPDLSSLLPKLEFTNPTLQALDSSIDAARVGIRLARLESYPEFALAAGYNSLNVPGMVGGRERMSEGMITFRISLPIWGEKNKGRRDEATAMLESASQTREATSRMLRAQLETLLSRGRDAARRAGLFSDDLLPKSRQAHESVEASYRAGKASLLDVFDSRRRLLETETGFWRAVTESHAIRAEIDALFGTSIQTPKL